jgi:phosphoribosyl-ATP pyrophosphohydrolase
MLQELYQIIKDRQINPQAGSYTNQLLTDGYQKIAQKVGEEAVEVILAAGNEGKQRVIEEAADLIYHLWVLLAYQEIDLAEIKKELADRHRGNN